MARRNYIYPGTSQPIVPVRIDQFALGGGLDLESPQLSLKPGFARDSQNWECSINGGYTRIAGYERFSGQPAPSVAVYGTIIVSSVTGIAVGDTVNGQTSGATGVVAYIDVSVPATPTVVYTKATGTFIVGENLRKVSTVIGTISTVGVLVTNQTTAATYALAAGNIYRADIGPVGGASCSGPVRGGFTFQNLNYAWRNNAAGTAATLWREGSSGWTQITFPYEVAFTAGSGAQPAEGSTITKGAVSAVVRRVAVQTGTFLSGTAAGRFIVDLPVGGSFSAGAFTGGVTATCTGAQTQVSFLPGGRFEVDIGNAGNGVRVYGTDGVNRGWEFDGTYMCPITTGNTVDSPLHCKIHRHTVFFSFVSSSQNSGTGTPFTWTIISGAAEIAVDSAITGYMVLPGDATTAAMAILSNQNISILYGTSTANFTLVELKLGLGCKPYSAQTLTSAYIYDDLGIAALDAVQQYGNFAADTLTVKLRSFVQQRRTLVTDSLINKEKSQYRVFFSDGYALYMTIVNGKYLGAMPMYFPAPVAVAWSGQSANGTELSYFGSTDGYVYKLGVGTSFDSGPIAHYCELAFASQGNVRMNKRYRRGVFEMQGTGYAEFSAGYSLSYGDNQVVQGTVAAQVNPVYWDQFTWDNFIWDGRAIAPSQLRLGGTAENIAIRMSGSSALWPEFTVNSIAIHYTPRRLLRN